MCGGAIISGYIPPSAQPRRVTAGDLWPHLRKGKSYSSGKKLAKGPTVDIEEDDDDFEADFQEFESPFDDVEVFDVKPLSSPSKPVGSKGIISSFIFLYFGCFNWVTVVKIGF